jgi:hypothetical protein
MKISEHVKCEGLSCPISRQDPASSSKKVSEK